MEDFDAVSPPRLKSALKRVFGKETLSKIVRGFRGVRRKVSRGTAVWFLCQSFIILSAVLIRILPLNWGFYLSEFDPYFHYRVTDYVVENGFSSWFDWHDDMCWHPYGRDIASTSFPGLPFTGALLHFFLVSIGLPVKVLDACIIFPVIMAAITCVAAYFFGKDIGGKEAGLFCSLFLALNSAYIARTSLGFYDDETVGILAIVLLFLFYLRSLEPRKSWPASIGYAVAAGLSLGYICASWGAARYPLSLIPVFTLVLLILKRHSSRLLLSYSTLMGTGLLIATHIPKLGYSFLKEASVIAVVGVFLLLCMSEIAQFFETRTAKIAFVACLLVALGLAAVLMWHYGYISLPAAKFMSVINPFERITMPLVESVQEHRPTTWAAFYYEFGLLVFLAPLGFIFASQRPTNHNVFLITYALTSMYFASSMIRLTIIMAPALCALGALAVVRILKPFADIATRRPFPRRRVRFAPRVGKEFSISFMICLFLLLFPTLWRGIVSARAPTTIASASIPMRQGFDDWLEALIWMRENLPEDAVVAAWWDHGYWITVVANRRTLADNGTINGTQIAQIAELFMSNESQALPILKQYETTHVVVFTTFRLAFEVRRIAPEAPPILYGYEVRWVWMAKIAGLNETELGDTSITSQLGFGQLSIPKNDILLTKLMIHGAFPEYASLYFGVTLEHFDLVFSSNNRMVLVYEVKYD